MNRFQNTAFEDDGEENVLFGVIGAFLFSLVGGLLYVLLSRIGYIAALSGLVGVVCAIKGYVFFARKESRRGVILAVIVAALVLILAWYIGFCWDMMDAYQYWYETGESEYALTFFECLVWGFYDLPYNLFYLWDLALSLGLGALGCWSYVANKLKRKKAASAASDPALADTISSASQDEDSSNQ